MDAIGVSHIAICVRDLEQSLAFYRDILGMRVTFDEVQDTTTGGLPYTYRHDRKTRRTVHIRYGEGRTTPSLVLTSHPGEESDGDPIRLDQVGISHLSFTVKDLTSLTQELLDKGVKFAGPVDSFKNSQGEVSSIFVFDPDGILVQFDNGGSA